MPPTSDDLGENADGLTPPRHYRHSDPLGATPMRISQAELLSFRIAMDKAEEAEAAAEGGVALPEAGKAASDAGVFPEDPAPLLLEAVTLLDIDEAAQQRAPTEEHSDGGAGGRHQRAASESAYTESSVSKTEINPNSNPQTRAAEALEAFGRMGIFSEDNTTDGKNMTWLEKLWANKALLTMLALLLASFVILGVGVLLQKLPAFHRTGDAMAFRWCYFTGGIIPIYYLCKWGTIKVFHTIELVFFREFLAHYESLTKTLIRTTAMGMLLVWYYAVFEWAFCNGDYQKTCAAQSYRKIPGIIKRIILCLLIATIASLIASACTKAISTHFYRSTHFKKLHEALGKEFQLKVAA